MYCHNLPAKNARGIFCQRIFCFWYFVTDFCLGYFVCEKQWGGTVPVPSDCITNIFLKNCSAFSLLLLSQRFKSSHCNFLPWDFFCKMLLYNLRGYKKKSKSTNPMKFFVIRLFNSNDDMFKAKTKLTKILIWTSKSLSTVKYLMKLWFHLILF